MTQFGHPINLNFNKNLCLSEFFQEVAPELVNEKLKPESYALCYQGFTLQYSGLSKTPLWVAEKLSPERLSIKIKREDNFHEESRLPEHARAKLEDYRSSGYDRGHMAPNADMNNTQAQYDSFSLANMIPQTPENNQNTWREIEEATRSMVTKYKLEAYVITGGAFLNKTVKPIKKGHTVLVPSHVYKVIYFPQVGMASAYLAPNDKSKTAKIVSICELEEKTGISFFPRLDENSKRQVFNLPMRANQVKANKQPTYIKTDVGSQCAPIVSAEQIKKTQQLFIVDENYTTQNKAVLSSIQDQLPKQAESNDTKIPTENQHTSSESFNLNQLLLSIIEWLKQQDSKS